MPSSSLQGCLICNPKPAVLTIAQHEGYTLERMRAPGQKLLAGFETGQGGALPAHRIFPEARQDAAGAAVDLASSPAATGSGGTQQRPLSAAASGQRQQSPTADRDLALPLSPAQVDSDAMAEPASLQQAVQRVKGLQTHQTPSRGSADQQSAAARVLQPGEEGFELLLQLPPDEEPDGTIQALQHPGPQQHQSEPTDLAFPMRAPEPEATVGVAQKQASVSAAQDTGQKQRQRQADQQDAAQAQPQAMPHCPQQPPAFPDMALAQQVMQHVTRHDQQLRRWHM